MRQYRHGDVYLTKVSAPPRAERRERPGNVLAEGEVTGHAHKIVGKARLYEWKESLHVRVESPACLIHEQHARIDLPPGTYRVTIQREWTPEGPREVED
ncbi:MAG: hypothetical protein HY319_22810 [Armatimonadetes bacterium]|nr:hypothetical protein [Armatimonadota bacterium]